MPMKNPAHPGRKIKNACLEPLGLSVTRAANVPGVSRNSLSRAIHGHAAVSPEMAIRLEKVGWSTAGAWLRLQTAYDLAQARKNAGKINVKKFEATDIAPPSKAASVFLP